MICIARTFGAPDTVPAGTDTRSASSAPYSGRSRPVTFDTMCMTWLYRSTVITSLRRTDPYSATRPTSLRARSTSMTCSARSFGSASSSASSRRSSSSLAPRGRVPASGRLVTSPFSTRTMISGLDPSSVASCVLRKNMNGDGLMTRNAR